MQNDRLWIEGKLVNTGRTVKVTVTMTIAISLIRWPGKNFKAESWDGWGSTNFQMRDSRETFETKGDCVESWVAEERGSLLLLDHLEQGEGEDDAQQLQWKQEEIYMTTRENRFIH